MRLEDGSSLPLGEQLRRVEKLQVLHVVLVLHGLLVPLSPYHAHP
jgi:hypothetical protein